MRRCPTCGARDRRSVQANRRYWALLNVIAERVRPVNQDTGEVGVYSPDTWHLYFRQAYLGCDDIMLPNGQVLTIPRSTTDTDVAEFNDYLGQIEAWAAERDAYLPDLMEAHG